MSSSHELVPHGQTEAPTYTPASEAVTRATYPLYFRRSKFIGCCFAVNPIVVVTTAHHLNLNKDDVGDFAILLADNKQFITAEYAAKSVRDDIMVLWLTAAVPHTLALRGYLPPVGASVCTVWLTLDAPHTPVRSPGVVCESGPALCSARGSVTTTGCSGAPVVDVYGDHVVGMHVQSNTKDASRISQFIPARQIVGILSESEVVCRH